MLPRNTPARCRRIAHLAANLTAMSYVPRVSEPARWGARRRLLDALDTLHLARPMVRLYELALASSSVISGRRARTSADDVPLPPARLRVQIGPLHADADFFLRSGRGDAELVQRLLAEH